MLFRVTRAFEPPYSARPLEELQHDSYQPNEPFLLTATVQALASQLRLVRPPLG